jgi:hypothetical protein
VTAKDMKNNKNIDSPTHGRRDASSIITAAQSTERPLSGGRRDID